jgi:hypothetical protein
MCFTICLFISPDLDGYLKKKKGIQVAFLKAKIIRVEPGALVQESRKSREDPGHSQPQKVGTTLDWLVFLCVSFRCGDEDSDQLCAPSYFC